jgi:glycyl-tRNA synthetase (class II)
VDDRIRTGDRPAEFQEGGSIGKRHRCQDEIGTP